MNSLRTLRERFIDYMKEREGGAKTDYNPFWEYMARWLTDQDHDTWLLLNEHKKEVERDLLERVHRCLSELHYDEEVSGGEISQDFSDAFTEGGYDYD